MTSGAIQYLASRSLMQSGASRLARAIPSMACLRCRMIGVQTVTMRVASIISERFPYSKLPADMLLCYETVATKEVR